MLAVVGAGLRRRTATRLSGGHRRFQPQQHGTHHRAGWSLQAKTLRGERDRHQVPQQDRSAHGAAAGFDRSNFEKTSMPMFNSAAKKAVVVSGSRAAALGRRPSWRSNRSGEISVDRVEEMTRETTEAFEMFRPFTVENAYVFRSDNVRTLFARIRKTSNHCCLGIPEKFDWYDYWLNIHLPGLKKWVFPNA